MPKVEPILVSFEIVCKTCPSRSCCS